MIRNRASNLKIENKIYFAWSGLPHASEGGGIWVWKNGGMVMNREKPEKTLWKNFVQQDFYTKLSGIESENSRWKASISATKPPLMCHNYVNRLLSNYSKSWPVLKPFLLLMYSYVPEFSFVFVTLIFCTLQENACPIAFCRQRTEWYAIGRTFQLVYKPKD